jgi:hypothetical protein
MLNRLAWAFVIQLIFVCACIGTLRDSINVARERRAKARRERRLLKHHACLARCVLDAPCDDRCCFIAVSCMQASLTPLGWSAGTRRGWSRNRLEWWMVMGCGTYIESAS